MEDKIQLVDKYPNSGSTPFSLGLHEEHLGRTEEAQRWLFRALPIEKEQFRGDHPKAVRTLHRLER